MRKATLPRLHIVGVAVLAVIVAACAAAQNAEVKQGAQQATPAPKPEQADQALRELGTSYADWSARLLAN